LKLAGRLRSRVVSDVLPRVGLTSLSRLRQANRALKRAVEDGREKLAERERSIRRYQEIVAENEASIRRYQEIIAEDEASIRRYQEIIAEDEASIRRYQEIAAEYERSIHATQKYQEIAAEHERSIRNLQEIVDEREQSIGQYQRIVAEHERSIVRYEEIAAEYDQAVQSIQKYREIVAEHERSIQQYQAVVAEQQARLGFVDYLEQLKRQIAADSEATAELTAMQSRTLAIMHAQLDGIAQLTADLAAKSYVHCRLEELGEGAAELLNYANGDRGFAAQAGLWFNWPIRASFRAGQASISDVNERIVEVPFAIGALASLEPGSRVLDVGATGSSLALSLACLGHEVIALDRRPYPLAHPRLSAVAAPIDEWSGPEQPLDAVVSISAPARTGLDQEDTDGSSPYLDRKVLDRFRQWLRPGGLLVLSVTSGAGASDTGGQPCDADDIAALLDGWQVLEQRFALQTGPLQWTIIDGEPTPASDTSGGRTVVLIRATPTQ
jgi:hypothetical protein